MPPQQPPSSRPLKTLLRISFGIDGNSLPHLLHGFDDPEDGFTWSIGTGCGLALHASPPRGALLLQLQLVPLVSEAAAGSQLLVVRVNSAEIGRDRVFGEATLAYPIPDQALRTDGLLLVELSHPEATSPDVLGLSEDERILGFMHRSVSILYEPPRRVADLTVLPPLRLPAALEDMAGAVRAATGMEPRSLVERFESLGHNCEFGIVQRQVGAEPVGLLRFAGITMENMLDGLRHSFAGVGEDVAVRINHTASGQREFMVEDLRYRILLHTFRTDADVTESEARAEHATRLRFAHRRLVRWLRTGERIFVFQCPGQTTLAAARALLAVLQSYGPNALLYVDQDADLPSGAVAQVGAGLYHGKLTRLAPPEDVGDSDLAGWLSLCVNAWRLRQAAALQP